MWNWFCCKNETFQALVDTILDNLLQVDKEISSLSDLDESIAAQLHDMVNEGIKK